MTSTGAALARGTAPRPADEQARLRRLGVDLGRAPAPRARAASPMSGTIAASTPASRSSRSTRSDEAPERLAEDVVRARRPALTAWPRSTTTPSTSARARSSSSRRDLPTPLSPPTSAPPPCPAIGRRAAAPRAASRAPRRARRAARPGGSSRASPTVSTDERPARARSPSAAKTSSTLCERALGPLREEPADHRPASRVVDRRRVGRQRCEDVVAEADRCRRRRRGSARRRARRRSCPRRRGRSPRCGLLAVQHLRRHVAPGCPTIGRPARRGVRGTHGDPEVEHLHLPAHHHHVAGLEIAVDDAAPVQVGERLERLHEQVEPARRAAAPCAALDDRAARSPRAAPS